MRLVDSGVPLMCRSGVSADVPGEQLDSWYPGYHLPGNVSQRSATLLALHLPRCAPGRCCLAPCIASLWQFMLSRSVCQPEVLVGIALAAEAIPPIVPYTFLRSVVCPSVVCHVRPPYLNRSMDLDAICQVHLLGHLLSYLLSHAFVRSFVRSFLPSFLPSFIRSSIIHFSVPVCCVELMFECL